LYNLMVTYTKGAWDRSAYEFGRDRAVGGYGDTDIADRYKDFSSEAIAELMTFPCLFVYEQGVFDAGAHIGWLTNIKPRQGTVRIEFELEHGLPPLPRDELAKLTAELDISRNPFTHTHWSVKDVDLLPVLINAGLLQEKDIKKQGSDSRLVRWGLSKPVAEMHIRPSVFRIPPGKPEPDLVSVMMPFGAAFSKTYTTIKAACEANELRCQRADDIWDQPEVIQDVFSLIYRSRVVVCDFTGRNPNVFYEAGIAHTLGKTVIPIVQNAEDIPFDLRHFRYIKYLDNSEGRESLNKELSRKLKSLVQG
jgi:hypothetical protein